MPLRRLSRVSVITDIDTLFRELTVNLIALSVLNVVDKSALGQEEDAAPFEPFEWDPNEE